MKQTIIPFAGLLAFFSLNLFTSCSPSQPAAPPPLTQQQIVQKNAETYLKERLDDPTTYEFVALELQDSVLYKDNIDYRKKQFQDNNQSIKDQMIQMEGYKKDFPSLYKADEVTGWKLEIAKNDKILAGIDSLVKLLGDKQTQVASYTYDFRFRNKNGLGAKVLNQAILQTNPSPDFQIINLAMDKKKVFLNPNDFPGYREMVASML